MYKTMKRGKKRADQLETLGPKEWHSGEFPVSFCVMCPKLRPEEAGSWETPMGQIRESPRWSQPSPCPLSSLQARSMVSPGPLQPKELGQGHLGRQVILDNSCSTPVKYHSKKLWSHACQKRPHREPRLKLCRLQRDTPTPCPSLSYEGVISEKADNPTQQ